MLRDDAQRLKMLIVTEQELTNLPASIDEMVLAVIPDDWPKNAYYHLRSYTKWLEKNDIQRAYLIARKLIENDPVLIKQFIAAIEQKNQEGFSNYKQIAQGLLAQVWGEHEPILNQAFLAIAKQQHLGIRTKYNVKHGLTNVHRIEATRFIKGPAHEQCQH